MNASAIYSKSGKGVQEASGKTSHLSRSDRAVLAAIDGRATLAEVAQKVGKTFDLPFEKLIESLDKGGFIRAVSAGTAGAAPKPAAGAKPAAKATGPMDAASDLDFTTIMSLPKGKAAPPPQAPPRATPPPPSAAEKAQAEKSAMEQQDAFAKAREEAERKAQAERDRVKAEAEAKMRAETEAKLRAETEARLKAEAEAKVRAEAEAKVKAAREAAARATAEAKAKAEAEARQAREEAERARREAEEIAERARKEAEEKARREQEELLRKLEEERKAREEAERRAREEAKRLEEEHRKLEEERRQREEEKRREEEERVSRRIQEERERVERRRQEREEEQARARAAPEEEGKPSPKPKEKEPAPEPAKAAGGGGFADTLLADLESFTTRDEQEQQDREEAARKEKEAAAARAREAEERRAKEEAERQEREEKERGKREEAERKAQEEAELREREEREKQRLQEEEEKRKAEAEERAKKAKQEEQLAAQSTRSAVFDAEARAKRERGLMARAPRAAAAAKAGRKGWGRPIALTLFLLLVVAVGVAHVMPIETSEYERAASEALGRTVKIGSARLSLVTGLQVKFSEISLGEGILIPEARAYPELDAVLGPRKAFSRIEVDRIKLDQDAVGPALFARVKGENFSVGRVVAKNLELTGPLALPRGLEVDVSYDGEGAVRAVVVRGPEALLARLTPKGAAIEVDMSASSFTLPFAPEISLSRFAMKGSATPQGLSVSEWDGALLNGTVSGTANVRWGESWIVEGVVTARNINAAVFAPALVSDGKAEGSGKFSMRGPPGKLAPTTRLDGSFTVTRGVLGSIDLSRAIQSGGKFATGRTQFNEMNGQATYDRGAVALRNITIAAGQLNAGASADIAENGALSGRIVADVRVASHTMRATLNLGGTVKEPQVRN